MYVEVIKLFLFLFFLVAAFKRKSAVKRWTQLVLQKDVVVM